MARAKRRVRVMHIRGGRDVQDFLNRKPTKAKRVKLNLARPASK